MPNYDFICEKCGHKFTVFCCVSSRGEQRCPRCSSAGIRQRLTALNTCGVKGSKSCSSGKCGSCRKC